MGLTKEQLQYLESLSQFTLSSEEKVVVLDEIVDLLALCESIRKYEPKHPRMMETYEGLPLREDIADSPEEAKAFRDKALAIAPKTTGLAVEVPPMFGK